MSKMNIKLLSNALEQYVTARISQEINQTPSLNDDYHETCDWRLRFFFEMLEEQMAYKIQQEIDERSYRS